MRYFCAMMAVVIMVLFASGGVMAWDWNSSPNNFKNSPYNFENSPYNFRNSPYNWDNSPGRYGNERIIRDSQGNARGYAVPRPDGGANFFDTQGNRWGYQPGPRR